jgi:sulfotransferase
MKDFICLSGLPRTGSTLLTSILSQNPEIHAEGNSAVCQLMWDMHNSCLFRASEQMKACHREKTIHDLISQIPNIYYKDFENKIIIDKCRSWTIQENTNILKKYINTNIKIIVLERSITDIVKSFARLHTENKKDINLNVFFQPMSEPIMRSISGLTYAKTEASKNEMNQQYLFLSYDELVQNPKETIQQIYSFCGWKPFEHTFTNVVVKYPEDDKVYGLKGHHEIRPKVEKKENNIKIPDEILKKCELIDSLLGYSPRTK